MKITKVVVGELRENCYILENNNKVLVVDPGDEYNLIKQELTNKEVIGILVTHYHFDHIGALDELKNDYNVPIYDNNSPLINNINDFYFEIIKTPGHTSDSVTFYFKQDKVMFVGDFVFKGTIGRTDLDTGNMTEMNKSINKIKAYNDDIKMYPGHGERTTLKDEKETNYFFI